MDPYFEEQQSVIHWENGAICPGTIQTKIKKAHNKNSL